MSSELYDRIKGLIEGRMGPAALEEQMRRAGINIRLHSIHMAAPDEVATIARLLGCSPTYLLEVTPYRDALVAEVFEEAYAVAPPHGLKKEEARLIVLSKREYRGQTLSNMQENMRLTLDALDARPLMARTCADYPDCGHRPGYCPLSRP